MRGDPSCLDTGNSLFTNLGTRVMILVHGVLIDPLRQLINLLLKPPNRCFYAPEASCTDKPALAEYWLSKEHLVISANLNFGFVTAGATMPPIFGG